jgi:glutaredoxin 3
MFEFITSWFKAAPVAKETLDSINNTIKQNKVTVFSKSYCPYCNQTKDLLNKLGQEYYVEELDKQFNGSTIQKGLQELTGQRTVPNIFINGLHIGGNSDLQQLNSSGQLKSMLSK